MGSVFKAIGNIFGFGSVKAPNVNIPDLPNPAAPIQDMRKEPTSPELGYTEGALAGKKKRGKSSLKIQRATPGAASGANIT
jgi:hypothetical protein